MKIYSMTATFGKLENQTLTLQPGLNIISAPNEWGKSTWCAFLATMLYGLDTREKTTRTTLAVKERYAPWSGSPMAGRMELNWNGKDITIERWTKGRTPLGEFRAYETESGLPVSDLTGSNCGEMLLGVERSVFLRAGYLRLSDLPVTADESLRRRLNALVTTGDESGAADELGQKLKDLKNRCRFNRTGLIPQAQEQKRNLENKLLELDTLHIQQKQQLLRQKELQEQTAALENHLQHLRFAAVQESLRQVEQAQVAAEASAEALAVCEDACAGAIPREEAVEQLHRHSALQQAVASLLQEQAALPPEPMPPQVPERYRGVDPADAIAEAEEDARQHAALEQAKNPPLRILLIFSAWTALMIVLGILIHNPYAWIAFGASVLLLGAGLLIGMHQNKKRWQQERADLIRFYGGISPDRWVEDAAMYAETQRQYQEALQTTRDMRSKVQSRLASAQAELLALTGGLDSQHFLLSRNQMIAAHDALADARKEHRRACAHADTLRAMVKPVPKPEKPDSLTLSDADTQNALDALALESRQIHQRLGQFQGRMDALGSKTAMQSQLEAVSSRLDKLNLTYNALELAQQTLQDAAAELQRRFAPRIAEAARDIFGKLTAGRYDRLNLTQELAVNTAAVEDVAIRSAQWRSDGTIDQLYLALRLAVARELTPEAPLILDDALVRFDDTRHAAAMDILRQEAAQKQIILFTCQSRET